jgi:hypothetical protein
MSRGGFRRFLLNRQRDETGRSGTGVVAEGAQFSNGKVVLAWLTVPSSVGVYDSMENMVNIHGHGGATQVQWKDGR